MADQLPLLQYKKLHGSEIRLVKFRSPARDESGISLKVEHHPLESAPPYYALSYAWGDLGRTQSIHADDGMLMVTENLLIALRHLKNLLDTLKMQ
jgi:hypothetical protein